MLFRINQLERNFVCDLIRYNLKEKLIKINMNYLNWALIRYLNSAFYSDDFLYI
jgi:hypothetical protein